MRILYLDIDCLRPDHLGCYGYHRRTSPHLDAVAAGGARFEQCYASDAPCLPSRTALWSGRCGFRTGVGGHGGTAADPVVEGPGRGFAGRFGRDGWMAGLRRAGYHTATVSPFAERHGAWHWCAGYNEIVNTGRGGMEEAAEVSAPAADWLRRSARRDRWFLHVNLWDPHTPYRTPESFGNPFAGEPLPAFFTEEQRRACWEGYGPHSAREPFGMGPDPAMAAYPRVPAELDSMEAVRRWVDGYDTGIRYADEHAGRLLNLLADAGVLDDTAVIVSSDHGECLGEFNVWGDHQTADAITCRVPMIVRWPGVTAGPWAERALHYAFDVAATVLELAGGAAPEGWDGRPFTDAFRAGRSEGRDWLVTSQQAWSCQRGVRFGEYLYLRTYHDGYKALAPEMLFNIVRDPHHQQDLAEVETDAAGRGARLLHDWYAGMAARAPGGTDPMLTVLREGGPFHTRGALSRYAARLRGTGRAHHAERLLRLHPGEA